MSELSFDVLQKACLERANSKAFDHSLRDWSITQWTNALAGETGELCNFAKKVERDGVNYDVDMGKELADIVIYAAIIAAYINVDLKSSLHEHFAQGFLRSRILTDWTNDLAALTGSLCGHASLGAEKGLVEGVLMTIVTQCSMIAEYIGLEIDEEVRNKFNEVSEKRGVDIKL